MKNCVARTTFICLILLLLTAACLNTPSEAPANPSPQAQTETSAPMERNPALIGFWHSSPGFSQGGIEAAWEFLDDQCLIKNNAANSRLPDSKYNTEEWYCQWATQDNQLILTFCQYQNGTPTAEEICRYAFDYTDRDETTGHPSLTINGQKHWKMDKPTDFIDGHPLYIQAASDLLDTDYQNRTAIRHKGTDSWGAGYPRPIIMYCDAELHTVQISHVDYLDLGSGYNYYSTETVFSLNSLSPQQYLEYTTAMPETIRREAIFLTDSNGQTHSYTLYESMRDGSSGGAKTEVLALP